ncbi:unnamed protein product [Staurois parvus]|uniref:Uncharacterized protein n=1 Tax=Staurois parvus TaxID=386267 RepID=A0ABN9CZH2_9NEOB|nr:unnamed protein product [Staurois parvus]
MIGTILVSNQLHGQLAETLAAFSVSPDGTGLPEKAVEGSGGRAILQLISHYDCFYMKADCIILV